MVTLGRITSTRRTLSPQGAHCPTLELRHDPSLFLLEYSGSGLHMVQMIQCRIRGREESSPERIAGIHYFTFLGYEEYVWYRVLRVP